VAAVPLPNVTIFLKRTDLLEGDPSVVADDDLIEQFDA